MHSALVDSLEKVLGNDAPRPAAVLDGFHASGFLGETLSLQLAVKVEASDLRDAAAAPGDGDAGLGGGGARLRDATAGPGDGDASPAVGGAGLDLHVGLGGPLAAHAELSVVRRVPVSFAAAAGVDEHYLVTEPGDYPDLLEPMPDGATTIGTSLWEALWIDVRVEDPALAGDHELAITVHDASGAVLAEHRPMLQIHPIYLPELSIINTHWLHADSLATYYDVPVLSEEHWELLEKYLLSAREMDVNSVLTPTWTPPLDTAVGHRRPTVQLIGISDGPGGYTIDLTQLDRWLDVCRRAGFRALEIAHLFTQWGARFTPAIVVDTPEGPEHRFGWHVEATDPEYRRLLEVLIPALRSHLEEHWDGEVLWHVSDEPGEEHLDAYEAAKAQVADLLEGATVVDALSTFEYASRGVVDTPIVATNHVGTFLENGWRPWVYYCVSQNTDVSNRFIALPSVRNRVLGRQLFVHDAPGFLHWGFNFWWTQYSLAPLDPFQDTCSGGNFPGGDPFAVYPGPDGTPWLSIRYRVFTQAMADHRALTLLASRVGRAAAKALVDEGGELTYSSYSYDVAQHLRDRRAVDLAVLAAG